MEKRYYYLHDLEGKDIYTICEINGVKSIHIFCYYWERDSDYEGENGRILRWSRTDATGIIIPLEIFIDCLKFYKHYIDDLWADTKQYQYDLTKEEAEAEAEGEYIHLSYEDITMDTPYGEYIS